MCASTIIKKTRKVYVPLGVRLDDEVASELVVFLIDSFFFMAFAVRSPPTKMKMSTDIVSVEFLSCISENVRGRGLEYDLNIIHARRGMYSKSLFVVSDSNAGIQITIGLLFSPIVTPYTYVGLDVCVM